LRAKRGNPSCPWAGGYPLVSAMDCRASLAMTATPACDDAGDPGSSDQTLVAERHAILAGVGAADQAAARAVDPDRLAAAMRTLDALDLVAEAREAVDHVERDAVLHLHFSPVGKQARQVERLLDVEAVFQQVGEEQRVAHRLE